MAQSVRSLLMIGNGKLGQGIHTFSLAAWSTCPGKSATCRKHCFARQGRYRFPAVKERLAWNLRQSRRDDFVPRLVREITRKGVLVLRLHPSGDLYDAAYAKRWLEVMKQCPKCVFYLYSRSHAVPDILPILGEMAALENVHVWFSLDRDMVPPPVIPPRVRLCFLQADEEEQPGEVDLVFRIRRLRSNKYALPMAVACPNETEVGRSEELVCGSCRKCFSE